MTNDSAPGETGRGTRELLGLCAATALAFLVYNMVLPLVPLLLLHLNASPSLLGLVISVSTLGSLFVAVPGGKMVNSWGSRRMMILFGGLTAVSCAFLAVFPSITGLFVGLIFFEIGKILFILGAQAHISMLGKNRDIDLDFGWYASAASIGQMAGPLIAGIWIDLAGHSFTWAFIALSMAATVAVLPRLISPGRMELREPEEGASAKRKKLSSYMSPYVFIAVLVSFVVVFADGARATFYPVLLRDFGYTATVIGLYMSLRGFVSMSFRFFMPALIRLAGGRFPALIASLFVLALGIGTTPFCRGPLLLTLNAVVLGSGLGMALPLSMATVSEGTSHEDRGVAMGIRLTGNRLAQLVNPVFFGSIAEHFGLAVSFVAGGILLFGSSLPILHWWRGESSRSESRGTRRREKRNSEN